MGASLDLWMCCNDGSGAGMLDSEPQNAFTLSLSLYGIRLWDEGVESIAGERVLTQQMLKKLKLPVHLHILFIIRHLLLEEWLHPLRFVVVHIEDNEETVLQDLVKFE